MDDRIKSLGLGAVRMALVAGALVMAFAGIGLSAVSTFCPQPPEAASTIAVAAPGTAVVLATIVEDDVEDDDATLPSEPADEPTAAPSDDATEAPAEPTGSCPDGARACAPPLLSSFIEYGEPACTEQASGELRSRLVPSLLGSAAMLAGAWALRPTHGEKLLSRH